MLYFEKYFQKNSFQPSIEQKPNPDLHICVVIPCFNEPNIIPSLESLYKCYKPKKSAEVIIVINAPENSGNDIIRQNEETLNISKNWIDDHSDTRLKYHIIVNNHLPAKHAGVGLARKIGMDEAAYRFNLINNSQGIITGFDADSLCDPNYFIAIEEHFQLNPKSSGASIYFEHPFDTNFDSKQNTGIIQYETHLRYLVQAMRYCGHPHAFHTVGSSFAVIANEYIKQGGMNKRQAGEDFYFLQKIIELGNYTEITDTRVIPSPRISNRVPFGTGASIKKFMESDNEILQTYAFEAFLNLKKFFSLVHYFYSSDIDDIGNKIDGLDLTSRNFLVGINYLKEISSIKENTLGINSFRNRFFRWFNAFMVIKYLNFASINGIERVAIANASLQLINELKLNKKLKNEKEILLLYRKLDQEGLGITYLPQ